MDGFEANVGVILLAATNRPEVLDRALLRPGRFDRQVVVDSPDLTAARRFESSLPRQAAGRRRRSAQDRAGHARLFRRRPGQRHQRSGPAGRAARAKQITQNDLEDAVEKVVAGPERKSRRLDDEDKRRVAYHEAGHALVAAYSKHADPVHKISIVPRGRAALGYTLQLPTEDQFLLTRAELIDRIKGLLGGRAREELIFDEVSTGAENDLEHATALARQMVCMYGMSESVGLVHCGQRPSMFLPGGDGTSQIDCSPRDGPRHRQRGQEAPRCRPTLTPSDPRQHRDKLEIVAQELIKSETVDSTTFRELLGLPPAAGPTT